MGKAEGLFGVTKRLIVALILGVVCRLRFFCYCDCSCHFSSYSHHYVMLAQKSDGNLESNGSRSWALVGYKFTFLL